MDSNANPNALFNGFGYAVTTTLTVTTNDSTAPMTIPSAKQFTDSETTMTPTDFLEVPKTTGIEVAAITRKYFPVTLPY